MLRMRVFVLSTGRRCARRKIFVDVCFACTIDGGISRDINVRFTCQATGACALRFRMYRDAMVGICRYTFAIDVGRQELISNAAEPWIACTIPVTHIASNIVLGLQIYKEQNSNEIKDCFSGHCTCMGWTQSAICPYYNTQSAQLKGQTNRQKCLPQDCTPGATLLKTSRLQCFIKLFRQLLISLRKLRALPS